MPFSPTAQTAKNVAEVVCCSDCDKPRVLHCAYKLREDEHQLPKARLLDVSYSGGATAHELLSGEPQVDEDPTDASKRKDRRLERDIFCRKNLRCSDPLEVPNYSSNVFITRCIPCACLEGFVEDAEIYPTCRACESKVKIYGRKGKVGGEGAAKKTKKA